MGMRDSTSGAPRARGGGADDAILAHVSRGTTLDEWWGVGETGQTGVKVHQLCD